MSESQLPQPFQELEPLLAWSLGSEGDRSAKRQASSHAEIKVFYDAMLVRIDEILAYLDQFSPEGAPNDVQRLFNLTLALAEVAPAIENFGQTRVVDGYDVSRFERVEILPSSARDQH
jgi:hypothetical protein